MPMLIIIYPVFMLIFFIQTTEKRPKALFQFDHVLNVLVSSFRFIRLPVILCVYGHYRYFTLSVRGWTLDVRF